MESQNNDDESKRSNQDSEDKNDEFKNYGDIPSISQPRIIILTIITAIVILAGIGLAYRLVVSPPPTSVAEGTDVSEATEDWPTVPPTFTSVPSPTLRPTITPTATPTPTPTPTPLPPPPWGELGYLTAIEYTTRTVVEVERKRFIGTDRILLMAVGKIQASVDLTQIKDSDVKIDGSSLKITLPHAIISSVELLPDESLIFDSERSWLFSQYEGLEIEALGKAREQLKEEAVSNINMLGLAEKFARLQLEEFLRQLGFEEVEITFKSRGT